MKLKDLVLVVALVAFSPIAFCEDGLTESAHTAGATTSGTYDSTDSYYNCYTSSITVYNPGPLTLPVYHYGTASLTWTYTCTTDLYDEYNSSWLPDNCCGTAEATATQTLTWSSSNQVSKTKSTQWSGGLTATLIKDKLGIDAGVSISNSTSYTFGTSSSTSFTVSTTVPAGQRNKASLMVNHVDKTYTGPCSGTCVYQGHSYSVSDGTWTMVYNTRTPVGLHAHNHGQVYCPTHNTGTPSM